MMRDCDSPACPAIGIATSVIVRPSRILQRLLLTMSVILIIVMVSLLRMPASGARLVLHHLFSVVCVAAVMLLLFACHRLSKVFVIDVSGTGAMRLHHTGRVAVGSPVCNPESQHSGEVVQLLKDSTLWSSMLLLNLRSAGGQIFVVPVCRDSMSAASFRSLSVACRWMAAQDLLDHI